MTEAIKWLYEQKANALKQEYCQGSDIAEAYAEKMNDVDIQLGLSDKWIIKNGYWIVREDPTNQTGNANAEKAGL